MDGLTQFLASVAKAGGTVVGTGAIEEMPDDQYDAAESRGMESPYGYDPGEHFIFVHVTD